MEHRVRTLGIIGCGAIGTLLGRHVQQHLSAMWTVGGVCASTREHAVSLGAALGVPAVERRTLLEHCELVVEATSAKAMPAIVRDCLAAGVPVLTLSVGGFALESGLQDEVEKAGALVHVPSGAIAGLDGIMALREQGLDRVELITVKHPRSLPEGTWENGTPLESVPPVPAGLLGPHGRSVFAGSAAEAIQLFPSNANVSIALSLAGLGFQRTLMRIFADADAQGTTHCVRATAGQSSLETLTRTVPLADNPRSALMAVSSSVALLRKLGGCLRVGT